MTLILVPENGAPRSYSFEQLRQDHPHVSFPREPSEALLAEFGVHSLVEVERQASSDEITKQVIQGEPMLLNGAWTQTWVETDRSPSEVLARQARALELTMRESVKADSFVDQFIRMTPEEVTTYIGLNVTNLASAKTVINKLALMVLLLARREFR